MRELFAGWRFAWSRLYAGWRFMLIAAVGVLAAAALLAMAPIYTAAMSDLGLRFRIDRDLDTSQARLATIAVSQLRLGDPVADARREAIDTITDARVGWLADRMLTEERSERVVVTFPEFAEQNPERPMPPPADATEAFRQEWGGFFFTLDRFEDRIEVTEGRLPGDPANGAEVVVPEGFQPHVALGDVIHVEGPGYDDCPEVPPSDDPSIIEAEEPCRPSISALTIGEVTVVGFVQPRDPDDPTWAVYQGEWEVPPQPFLPRLEGALTPEDELFLSRAMTGEGSMPLLTTHEQFFGAIAAALPELPVRHRVGFLMETDAISLGEVSYAVADLRAWQSDLRDRLNLPVEARLEPLRTLERFQNLQSFSQIALLLILIQVVGIVLYYVMIVMAMLLERQAEEVGVYRSRGATTTQIVGIYLVEGLILAVPAVILGPWLAAGVVALLGTTPVFHPSTGGALLPVSISPEAYLLGAVGAGVALLAILLPAFVAARRGIVDVKRAQARPTGRGLVQRYYLDFAVVVLAGLLLWQLDQRGSVYDPDSVGGWSSDPLLLLAPLVVTMAVALMVLRLYPPLLRIAVSMLLLLRGTAIAIGLRRAGRSPAGYARLVLLLILAISVGTFAASYGPTVDRSYEERARYDAGVALRAPLHDERNPSPAAIEAVLEHPAVADIALVHRGQIAVPDGREIPLLAIDVPRGREMLWSREDFTERPFDGALGLLQSDVAGLGGIPVPDGAVRLEVALQSGNIERGYVRARLLDTRGNFHTRVMSLPDDATERDGWVIASTEHLPVTEDLLFVGLLVSDRTTQNLRVAGSLMFDALTAVHEDGTRTVIEDFEGPLGWTMYRAHQVDESFALVDSEAYEGTQAVEWTWAEATMPGRRVFAPIDAAVPLRTLADTVALGRLGTSVGGVGNVVIGDVLIPVHVREVASFFPTLRPGTGFVVMNREHLRSAAGLTENTRLLPPTELWVEFEPGTSLTEQEAVMAWLATPRESPILIDGHRTVHRDALLDEARTNPTLRASGSGILVVAFGTVLGLAMLGFTVTLVLGARARVLEFAVLRAVGSSRTEILRALLLEWGVVLVVGGIIGVLLGRQVAWLMLSFLEVTAEGDRVLPPFVLVTDWWALAAGIGVLVGVVAVALVLSWVTSMRQAGARELRVTQ